MAIIILPRTHISIQITSMRFKNFDSIVTCWYLLLLLQRRGYSWFQISNHLHWLPTFELRISWGPFQIFLARIICCFTKVTTKCGLISTECCFLHRRSFVRICSKTNLVLSYSLLNNSLGLKKVLKKTIQMFFVLFNLST